MISTSNLIKWHLAQYATVITAEIVSLPIWEGVKPFFANLYICSFTSSDVSFNHLAAQKSNNLAIKFNSITSTTNIHPTMQDTEND